jgi:hypothetical protein
MADTRIINDVMATADGRYAIFTREGASSRRNGIVILSLEDPAHPKQIAEYTETVTGGVHSAFVYTQPTHGTHVYLTDDATGSMRVIDLNDPRSPKEIARWQTRDAGGRMLHDIDVRDGLATSPTGTRAWWSSISAAASRVAPRRIRSWCPSTSTTWTRCTGKSSGRAVRGSSADAHRRGGRANYVFAGDEVFTATPRGVQMPGIGLGKANGRIHVIDVSDMAAPREVAWYEPGDGGAHNVWVAGDTLYMGDYQGGLRVVDVSGELRGDLLAQGREMAKVHTGDARGFLPNAAMTWGAFYHNGLVWANDIFSGLWAVRLEPRQEKRP